MLTIGWPIRRTMQRNQVGVTDLKCVGFLGCIHTDALRCWIDKRLRVTIDLVARLDLIVGVINNYVSALKSAIRSVPIVMMWVAKLPSMEY